MSATILKDRVVAVLEMKIADYANMALRIQRFPGQVGGGKSIPPWTTEDIAMIVLEANAFRRGVEASLDALKVEHQKLVAPDTPVEPEEAETDEEPTY